MDNSPLFLKVAYEPWTVAEGQGHFAKMPITTGRITLRKESKYRVLGKPFSVKITLLSEVPG